MTTPMISDAEQVRTAIDTARDGLVDRETIPEIVALCAVAGEHLLVIGAPGTAKSAAVRRIAQQVGGEYFEYLLGRFTEPNEIFGPVDLHRLREGVIEIRTEGMLPRAEVAFLDEVFLGSTAVLNTLLGILNERTFRRGSTAVRVPLRICVGAANTLPDDPALAAFADRFLARIFVDPVADDRLEELLEQGWAVDRMPVTGMRLVEALDRLASVAAGCDLAVVRPQLSAAIRRLKEAGITITDRRAVRSQRLIAAAAALDGRDRASAADLWVLPLIAPSADEQAQARAVLADLLLDSRNSALGHAAEELSRGPVARAERLVRVGRRLLDEAAPPTPDRELDLELDRDTRLRFEATLREIDAGFAEGTLPEQLGEVRAALVAAVRP